MTLSNPVDRELVKQYLIDLQGKVVETIEIVDGTNFLNDTWQRKEGGGGRSIGGLLMIEGGTYTVFMLIRIYYD